MKKEKPKLTRADAERLFDGLPAANTRTSSRPENPFETGVFSEVKRVDEESRLWKDNLITLPTAIELPTGYDSASQLRAAMTQTLGVKWLRANNEEVVAEFPDGWKSVRPKSGPVELRDSSDVVRAHHGWAKDAELRVLPRYLVESQSNSSNGLGSLVVRDRANGQVLERSSIWSAQTGTNHPDWKHLSTWLTSRYPDHDDPLRYWEDCESNRQK
jgi:hypothetical protein